MSPKHIQRIRRAQKELDPTAIKADFPIFRIKVHGKPLVYLDSAATSQKPKQVIDAIVDYYSKYNANIHRGVYEISEKATEAYEGSREKVANLINARSIEEIVYTRNTTEVINLVALSWGNANIRRGDHILISEMEHHSNLVPWQMLAERSGAVLDYIKLDSANALLDIDSVKAGLEKRPKLVALSHVSNVLGTINDVDEIVRLAHEAGAFILIDGAQSVPHMPVNVSSMDCDFFAFSGHKMLGPAGIGVLYAKRPILEGMEPVLGGGDMIRTVKMHSHTWNDLPWRFEAGTPNIEGGIGLGAAIDYLNRIGMGSIRRHEMHVTKYALETLDGIKGVRVFGTRDMNKRGGVIAFAMDGVHPHDIASIFDSEGIAIRAGQHCAMPLVTQVLKEDAVARISFYIYNSEEDVDEAAKAIEKVKKIFKLS